MKKILILTSLAFMASCGNNQSEENSDKTDTTTAATTTDTVAMADTIVEEPCKVHVECMWNNEEKDIPQAYVDKINNLVNCAPIPEGLDEMDYVNDYLTEGELKKLNATELIYYCIAYPASFSQSCGFDDFYDSTNTPKILSFFNDNFAAYSCSDLQNSVLEKRRDSVIIILNKFIASHPKKTNENYLVMLKNLKAMESIPVVVKVASVTNLYPYTFLINMMGENPKFQSTEIYNTMFGENSYIYGRRIEATTENRKLLVDLAMKMYRESKL